MGSHFTFIFFRRGVIFLGYLSNIHKRFLDKINEKQDFMFLPNLSGRRVKSDVMFQQIYRNLMDEKNRRTFLANLNITKQFKCESIEKVIEKKGNFTYFTPAVYWHHRKHTKEELIWLTCIILDFDFSKDGTGREYSSDELAGILLNEFDLTPNFIWDTKTKGNKQVCFLIEPMAGTMNSIYLWEAIVKRLSILTGSDFSSTDAVHIFRIPKKGLHQYSDEIYDIEDFAFVLEDEEINSLLEKERRNFSKVLSFTEHQIMNHISIKKLIEANFDGSRNHAAFTIALLYYALGKDKEEVLELLNGEWFRKVNENASKRYLRREIKDSVKSAYSGKYSGPSKEWIYTLTGEEFPYNLWKSSYVKKDANERKYKIGEEVRQKIIYWVRENTGQTIDQKELAQLLEIPYATFKKQISKLKEESVIEFKAMRGRYSKGTTFTYLPNKTFEVEYDNGFKKDLPIYPEIKEKNA